MISFACSVGCASLKRWDGAIRPSVVSLYKQLATAEASARSKRAGGSSRTQRQSKETTGGVPIELLTKWLSQGWDGLAKMRKSGGEQSTVGRASVTGGTPCAKEASMARHIDATGASASHGGNGVKRSRFAAGSAAAGVANGDGEAKSQAGVASEHEAGVRCRPMMPQSSSLPALTTPLGNVPPVDMAPPSRRAVAIPPILPRRGGEAVWRRPARPTPKLSGGGTCAHSISLSEPPVRSDGRPLSAYTSLRRHLGARVMWEDSTQPTPTDNARQREGWVGVGNGVHGRDWSSDARAKPSASDRLLPDRSERPSRRRIAVMIVPPAQARQSQRAHQV